MSHLVKTAPWSFGPRGKAGRTPTGTGWVGWDVPKPGKSPGRGPPQPRETWPQHLGNHVHQNHQLIFLAPRLKVSEVCQRFGYLKLLSLGVMFMQK